MAKHGKYGPLVRGFAALTALFWGGAAVADAGCRLALVLALDVSSSVDAREYDLQRVGLASALGSRDVRHAILQGAPGHVALSVYEWSGYQQQKLQLDWTVLDSHAAIDAAVATLAGMDRSHDDFPTSMGAALAYGARLLQREPACSRRVIDVSGDGVNNYRYGPAEAYRHFPLSDVTVNGLVILGDQPDVARFYGEQVLRGPGAFMLMADGFEAFEEAMTRKLYREINEIIIGGNAKTGAPG